MPVNNDALAFSSNWKIDQVFQEKPETATVPAGSGFAGINTGTCGRLNIDIPHSKGRPVFCLLRYRVAGKSAWFQEGNGVINGSNYNTQMVGVQGYWVADSTKVRITFINGNNTAQTVEYRYMLIEDNPNDFPTI